MERYLLDTNAVSGFIRGDNERLSISIAAAPIDAIRISSITEAELLYGLARKPEAAKLASLVHAFLAEVESLPWGSREAQAYAALRAANEKAGRSLSLMDTLIAAQAMATDAVLISADKALLGVAGLRVADWSR